MSEMIQGFKIQCHINSIDFNSRCSHFATGGRDHVTIFSFRSESLISIYKKNAGSKTKKISEDIKALPSQKLASVNLPGTKKEEKPLPLELPQV